MPVEVDILEDSIFRLSPELLNNLLKDHTTSKEDIQRNIFWATSDYEYLGEGYQYDSLDFAQEKVEKKDINKF